MDGNCTLLARYVQFHCIDLRRPTIKIKKKFPKSPLLLSVFLKELTICYFRGGDTFSFCFGFYFPFLVSWLSVFPFLSAEADGGSYYFIERKLAGGFYFLSSPTVLVNSLGCTICNRYTFLLVAAFESI